MFDDRIFRIRYTIDPSWNKPAENYHTQGPFESVRKVQGNDGYCDNMLLASIVFDNDGYPSSVFLLEAETGGPPSRETLLLVKRAIDRQLTLGDQSPMSATGGVG